MSTPLYADRRRAGSFGADAERYDRSRPSYPADLVDDLLSGGAAQVLDVGCGTGIAARLFEDRGCQVLGLEPDPRMAAVARRRGLVVEVGRVEDWDPRGRTFDLVVSGQAWHWVEPYAGARKASEVVRPGGSVGLFWNAGRLGGALRAAVDAIYARLAPGLDHHSIALGHVSSERFVTGIAGLRATGAFTETELRRYRWSTTYTRDQWLDQLPTHSDHQGLEPDRLRMLLAEIGAAIDASGGLVSMAYDTWALIATRR